MAIFYSPSRNGFFDEHLHGFRTMLVPDEKKLKAAIEDVRAEIGAAEEAEVPDETEEMDEAAQQDRAAQIEAARQALTAKIEAAVQALVSDPPVKEVDNPDCLLPADVVEISPEQHAALMSELGGGKVLGHDEEGRPVAKEPVIDIEAQIAALRRERDRALQRTDWTQQPDALTAAKRKLWKDHRQALRDLPKLVEAAVAAGQSVNSVPFPTPPG